MPADGGDADALLARFAAAGVDLAALAAQLQSDGAQSFVEAWNELMDADRGASRRQRLEPTERSREHWPSCPLRERPGFAALAEHHAEIEGRHLRDLFADDPARGERLSAEAVGLYLDYSKNRITDETVEPARSSSPGSPSSSAGGT